MKAYFDKENLVSFLSQEKTDLFNDSIRFLKRQVSIDFNFPKEECKENMLLMHFLSKISDGVRHNKQTFRESTFPDRAIKSNTYNGFNRDEMTSLYFINDPDLQKLKNKNALLVADVGEEMELFKLVFLNNEDYKFDAKFVIGSDFTDWKQLEEYHTPLTDIIIIDPYILNDTSLIPSNLLKLISGLLHEDSRNKINIVIYTNRHKVNIDFEDLKKLIQDMVEKKVGVKPNITLICYMDKKHAEHDRTVVTNYLRLYSGDSFNYFNSAGEKITKGRELIISSLADEDNYKLFCKLIDDLQNNVNQLKGSTRGDKKSNFISLP